MVYRKGAINITPSRIYGKKDIIIALYSNIKSMVKFICSSSKKRGFLYSLRIAIDEIIFDAKYHIDTVTIQAIDRISDVPNDEKKHAFHYQASYVTVTKRLLKNLGRVTDNQGTFIDLGSGKGRVMMLAALQGYQNIIGVEFSNMLNEICRANLLSFAKNSLARSHFTTTVENAAKYKIPQDTSVVFMGNPFGEHIMLSVVKNIEISLALAPREIFIAYFNPLFADLFIQNGYHIVMEEKDPSGALIFQVFGNKSPTFSR